MNNEDRDDMLCEIHDCVLLMRPIVAASDRAINGNGRRGLLDRVTRIEAIAVLVTVGGLVVGVVTLCVA